MALSTAPPITTLTTAEYHSARRHANAGPASDLRAETVREWTAMNPRWRGWHWHMHFVPGLGTCLSPINVVAG